MKLIFILLLCWGTLASAQSQSVFSGSSIELNEYGEQTKKKVRKLRVGKRHMSVVLGSKLTQDDFAAFCEDAPWVASFSSSMYGGSQLTSLEPLKGMRTLKTLDIHQWSKSKQNPLDLTPLADVINLQSLNMSYSNAINTIALKDLKRLTSVTFGYDCEVDSIDFVSGTELLESLEFHKVSNINDLKPLAKLKKLQRRQSVQNF